MMMILMMIMMMIMITRASECDPDYGWLEGPEGSNKCYMLIKGFDSS